MQRGVKDEISFAPTPQRIPSLTPLLWVTLAFAAGIEIALYWPPKALFTALCVILGIGTPLWLFRRSTAIVGRFYSLGPLLGFLPLAFFLGWADANRTVAISHPFPSDFIPTMVNVRGRVLSDPVPLALSPNEEPAFLRADLQLSSLQVGTGPFEPFSGMVRAYFSLPHHSEPWLATRGSMQGSFSIHYGDLVEARGKLEPATPLRDPGRRVCCGPEANTQPTLIIRPSQAWRRLSQRNGLFWVAMPLPLFHQVARWLRERAFYAIEGTLPKEKAELLEALLFGNRDGLSPKLSDAFERTGAVYLLSTAGLHLGMFALVFWWAVRRVLKLPRKASYSLLLLAQGLMVVMADGRPAVSRAAIMLGLYLLAPLLEREPDLLGAVAASALLLLALNPLLLANPGFQLSYLTVVTIALLAPPFRSAMEGWEARVKRPLARRLQRSIGRYMATTLFLCLAGQIGATPLVALHFHELSLVAPIANFLLLLIALPLLLWGYLAALMAFFHPLLARPLLVALLPALTLLQHLVALLARPAWAELAVGSPPWQLVALLYVGIGMAAWFGKRKQPTYNPNKEHVNAL